MPVWERVAVSARNVNWPPYCPCCCGLADTTVTIEKTVTTGVRVIRNTTREWVIPYCAACLEHQEAHRDLCLVRHRAAEVMADSTPLPDPPSAYILPYQVLAVVGWAFVAVMPFWLLILSAPNRPSFFALLFVILLLSGLLVAVFPYVYSHSRRLRRRAMIRIAKAYAEYHEVASRIKRSDQRRRDRARDDVRRAEGLICTFPSCASTSRCAIVYLGWYGSIHAFAFASQQYADMFRAAHHGKLTAVPPSLRGYGPGSF